MAIGTSDRYSEDELARVLLKECLPSLPKNSLKRFPGDGLYDKVAYYQPILEHSPGCSIKIPPAVNAKLWHAALPGADQRNAAIKSMRSKVSRFTTISGARRLLKQIEGYMQRNLIETTMSRLVRISGGRLKGKIPTAWMGQLIGMLTVLNYHTTSGWPERQRRWTPV